MFAIGDLTSTKRVLISHTMLQECMLFVSFQHRNLTTLGIFNNPFVVQTFYIVTV